MAGTSEGSLAGWATRRGGAGVPDKKKSQGTGPSTPQVKLKEGDDKPGKFVPVRPTPKAQGAEKIAVVQRQWTDKLPAGLKHDETWKEHYTGHPDPKEAEKLGVPHGTVKKERDVMVHQPIMREALDKVKPVPKGEQKHVIFTMGGPASGKTYALRDMDTKNFVSVDPDGIKEKLPEYKAATKPESTYRKVAAMAHEESSDIAKRLMHQSIAEGKHTIVDGTGANAASIESKMNAFREAGYKIHLMMPHQEYAAANERVQDRSEREGRLVPSHFVKKAYDVIPGNFEKIASKADSFSLHDATRDGAPRVWSKSSDGEMTVHDHAFVTKFRETNGKESQHLKL